MNTLGRALGLGALVGVLLGLAAIAVAERLDRAAAVPAHAPVVIGAVHT
jgi:hypothetical protein